MMPAGRDPHDEADLLDQAAALWMARRDVPDDALAAQALEAWLARSADHRAAWRTICQGWRAVDSVSDHERIAMLRAEAMETDAPPIRRLPVFAAMAACLALVAGAGLWVWHPPAPPVEPVTTQHYATLRGEHRMLVLADGSRVTLDADSQLDVRLEARFRRLVLAHGRAYFQVAHDRSRPFLVTAAGREVVAVGTEFDVSNDDGRVQVLLAQGRVVVRPAAQVDAPALSLTPGQGVVFDGQGRTAHVESDDIVAMTAWRHGRLLFDDERLSDAIIEVNRHRDVPLRIVDPSIADMPISGVFVADQPDSFVSALTTLFPVEAEIGAGSVDLRRASVRAKGEAK